MFKQIKRYIKASKVSFNFRGLSETVRDIDGMNGYDILIIDDMKEIQNKINVYLPKLIMKIDFICMYYETFQVLSQWSKSKGATMDDYSKIRLLIQHIDEELVSFHKEQNSENKKREDLNNEFHLIQAIRKKREDSHI